jgi:hypothetical protein
MLMRDFRRDIGSIIVHFWALLSPILRRMRQRLLVFLKPNSIAHVGIAAAEMKEAANRGGLPARPPCHGDLDQDHGERDQHPVLTRDAQYRKIPDKPLAH